MGICTYLAMTGGEFAHTVEKPEKIAWMSCHFSSCGRGLSNKPQDLPPGSMIILDDQIPMGDHDPQVIVAELQELAAQVQARSVLLDLQRPGVCMAFELAALLTRELPCPVGVSELYARKLEGPVFCSAPAPDAALRAHLAPWKGRELWLEIALDGCRIQVTEAGAAVCPLPWQSPPENLLRDRKLHCSYHIAKAQKGFSFSLYRTREDLQELLQEAEDLGITNAVGLYQQLGK